MTNGSDVAYPICQWYGDEHTGHTLGLTKREYFAAMAMQGMVGVSPSLLITVDEVAEHSLKLADALIAELNKQEKS